MNRFSKPLLAVALAVPFALGVASPAGAAVTSAPATPVAAPAPTTPAPSGNDLSALLAQLGGQGGAPAGSSASPSASPSAGSGASPSATTPPPDSTLGILGPLVVVCVNHCNGLQGTLVTVCLENCGPSATPAITRED